MKKRNLILSCLLCGCLVAGCSKNDIEENYRTYQKLSKDMVLDVGGEKFSNTAETIDTREHVDYLKNKIYRLNRDTYRVTNSVAYNGYYYYWSVENVYESLLLGTKTVTTTKDISYIIYGEEENISVKTKITETTKYSYESTILEKNFSSTFDFNGYFASLDEIKQLCPELLDGVEIQGINIYPVNAKEKTEIFYEDNNYSEFYYFEEIDDKK